MPAPPWHPGGDIPPESGAGRFFRNIAPVIMPYGTGVIPNIYHTINQQRMQSGNRQWREAAQNAPVGGAGGSPASPDVPTEGLPQGGPPNPLQDRYRFEVGLRPDDPNYPGYDPAGDFGPNVDEQGNPIGGGETNPEVRRAILARQLQQALPQAGGYPNFAGTRFDYGQGRYVPRDNATGAQFNSQAQNAMQMWAQGYGGNPNDNTTSDEGQTRFYGAAMQLNPEGGYEQAGGPTQGRSNIALMRQYLYGRGR